ncbi:MAG: hypothetical protein KJI71_01695 [Patescibacteria group bacterium]|nr:hypothetical protein [Patescibacteria group bacterium]
MLNKKKLNFLLVLLLIFIPIFSSLVSFGNSAIQEEDISVSKGTLVNVGKNYLYQGTFYDDSDPTFAWTTSKIEFVYIEDPTLTYSHAITSFENTESQQPVDETNVVMTNGTYFDTDNMQSNDDSNAQFDYDGVGVYNATYSFESDLDGSDPVGFSINQQPGCDISITSNLDGHKKVLKIYDNSGVSGNQVEQFFTERATGTVEYWLRVAQTNKPVYFSVNDGSWNIGSYLRFMDNGDIEYDDGSWHTIQSYSANTWYHIKIEFDTATDWHLWINGVSMDSGVGYSYKGSPSAMDYIRFVTDNSQTDFTMYLDAVAYSWDSGYTVGDNREDQDPLGHYPATYGFENELVYTSGTDISWVDDESGTDSSYSAEIVASEDGHKGVMKILSAGDNTKYSQWRHTETETAGTVEVWIKYIDNGQGLLAFYGINEGSITIISFWIDSLDNKIYIRYGNGVGGTTIDDYSAVADTWHHIKLQFSCATDKQSIWLNGVLVVDDENFYNDYVATSIPYWRFQLQEGDGVNSLEAYIDAYGESGDTTYNIGDNVYYTNLKDQDSDFESKDVGTSGTSIGFVSSIGAGLSAEIIPEFNAHKKVLQINTTVGGGNAYFYSPTFASQSSGTLEGWMNSSDATHSFQLRLNDGTATTAFLVSIENEKWQYHDGATKDVGVAATDDTWYHVKIEFECGSGGYKGLSADTFYVWIDNVRFGPFPFWNAVDNVDRLRSYLASVATYSGYFDAISYSWTSGNTVGDNQHGIIEAMIDFYMDIPFGYYDHEVMQLNIDSRHFTSILANMSFSIYNFTSTSWVLIDNDIYTSETLVEYDVISYDGISGLFDSNGNMRFKYYGFNSSEFNLKIDQLTIIIYFKTDFEYEKSLNLIGTWKYRFVLDEGLGTEHNSTYRYINIVQFEPNVELISESEYYTEWEILGSDFTENDLYEQDFGVSSDNWLLHDVSNTNFTILTSERDNPYLVENSSFEMMSFTYESQFTISGGADSIRGISFYNGYWYVSSHDSGGTNDLIIKYNPDWSYTGTSWNINSEDDYPEGIYFYDGYWYLAGNIGNKAYKYNPDWSYTGTSYDLKNSGGGAIAHPTDLFYYDGYWYVADKSGLVYKYDSSFNYVADYDVMSDTSLTSIYGLDVVNGEFYVSGARSGTQYAYKFDTSWNKIDTYPLEYILSVYTLFFYDGYWYASNPSYLVYRCDNIFDNSKVSNGDGYTYIQTNETETLKVRSKNNLNLTLLSGDKIEIQFNTSSSNKIDINVLNSGVEQGSYQISKQGNLNFDTYTKTISIDSDMTVDQLEFEGIFDDTKNLFIENIRIFRYISSGEIIEENVDPDGIKQIFLEYPNDFTCNVYEQNLLVYSVNFTSSNETITLIYEVPKVKECYISLYDVNNEYLDFNLFTTYVNYTYDGLNILNDRLSNKILSVDDDTLITFNIYDSFDVLVKNYETYEETFIDITLNIFSLKIKNEAIELVNFTLTNNNSNIEKSGNIFPGEIIEYQISSGVYIFNYTNQEDNSLQSININLVSHQILIINSTYFNVYFSLFNFDGLGLDPNLFRFYINGLRKDLGFNTITQDTNNLNVLDYFNATLFNQDLNLRSYTEYSINVEVYTLVINNNYTHSIRLEIERNDIEISQIVPAQSSLSYRFLPNVEYILRTYYTNGTLIEEKEIELDKNNKVVSFGFSEETVPTDPNPFFLDFVNFSIFLMVIAAIGMIGMFLYFRIKYQQKKLNPRIKKKRSRKVGEGTYNDGVTFG